MNKIFIASALFLSACSSVTPYETAQDIAYSSAFTQHRIEASPFLLTSFERVNQKGGTAQLYIEGDGNAWRGRRTPSLDPTPLNPLTLTLATQDPANNVLYLARPCQYSKTVDGSRCQQKYWTSHRFAPKVLKSMNNALDDFKARHAISGFHLIGFSGGGNIAALLTAKRDDVLSLRTVAGNLDHVLLHKIHRVSQTPASLNAKDIAKQISPIPQHHFIGAKDKIITPAISQSFIQAAGKNSCIRSTLIANAAHQKGWHSIWPALLQYPLNCQRLN